MQAGAKLTSRTPTRLIEITADARLIRQVLEICDGTRTLDEIGLSHNRLLPFISYLLDNDVLIDANHLTLRALDYGMQMSPYGRSDPARETDLISRRFARNLTCGDVPSSRMAIHLDAEVPLDAVFRNRVTTREFDASTSLPANKLGALLWSLSGIVETRHMRLGAGIPRRTHASAGALYLVTPYVVLLHRTDGIDPGVYKVDYDREREVFLNPVSSQHDLLPRAYTKPEFLAGATGAIILVGDIPTAAKRYRNRATQYLFTESGAILQNGALTAAGMEIGYAILGNYHEDVLARLCALEDTTIATITGTALFGPLLSNSSSPKGNAPEAIFSWASERSPDYTLPGFLGRTQSSESDESEDVCWGYDTDPFVAHTKALAEFVERQGMAELGTLVHACMAELPAAMDPALFARYSPGQFKREGFPYAPLAANQPALWKAGTNCASGDQTYLLAQSIYPHALLRDHVSNFSNQDYVKHTQATTSGCAAGESVEDALERALLELIERDAFMRHWLEQRPGTAISPRKYSADVRQRLVALNAAGCETGLCQLESDLACVVLAWAQHELMGFTTLGAAARTTLEEAAVAALGELETRAFTWLNGHAPIRRIQAREANRAADHFELYGQRRYFRRADQILREATGPCMQHPGGKSEGSTLDLFLQRSIVPSYVDITPARNTIANGKIPLTVVKAFVPGLIPLSFGYGLEPRGMVDSVHPASRFPHPFP